MENAIIRVMVKNNQQLVSARDLHSFLNISSRFNDWFNRMKQYGFVEGEDFEAVTQNKVTAQGNISAYTDFNLTMDTAKEIAMLQRNSRGKQARKYFIEVEKKFKKQKELSVPQTFADALLLAYQQQKKLDEQKPKVKFAETVQGSNDNILVGQLAGLLKNNGVDIGQNKLFKWLRDNEYIARRKGSSYNKPTAKSLNLGVMNYKESVFVIGDKQHISITPTITPKGQIYFINKLVE